MIFLDTETSGLGPTAEVLEIALLDHNGNTLLSSLVKPLHIKEWKEAEAIHGISPEMVLRAPYLTDLMPAIERITAGNEVVIYNAAYDMKFVNLSKSNVHCCMLQYADHRKTPGRYPGKWKWHKLSEALTHEGIEAPGTLHRAAADAEACRLIWNVLCKA